MSMMNLLVNMDSINFRAKAQLGLSFALRPEGRS
jgi:hypothetical protein